MGRCKKAINYKETESDLFKACHLVDAVLEHERVQLLVQPVQHAVHQLRIQLSTQLRIQLRIPQGFIELGIHQLVIELCIQQRVIDSATHQTLHYHTDPRA